MSYSLFSGFAKSLSNLMPDEVIAFSVKNDGSLEQIAKMRGSAQESFIHSEGRFLLKNTDYLSTSDVIMYMPYEKKVLVPGVIWKVNGVLYYPVTDTINQANQNEMIEVPISKPRKISPDLLTFPGLGSNVQDSESLNWSAAATTPFTVPVRIRATEDQGIRDYLGADQTDLAVVGFWGAYDAPLKMPSTVVYRTVIPYSISGQMGDLEITKGLPLEIQYRNLSVVFGQGFTGIWRAH